MQTQRETVDENEFCWGKKALRGVASLGSCVADIVSALYSTCLRLGCRPLNRRRPTKNRPLLLVNQATYYEVHLTEYILPSSVGVVYVHPVERDGRETNLDKHRQSVFISRCLATLCMMYPKTICAPSLAG